MAGMLQGFLSLQVDFFRTPIDIMAGRLWNSWLKNNAPHSPRGRAVVTLPGFAASSSTHRQLVGQSAGGLYAREFARMFPGEIDRVITLGSLTGRPANGSSG
jgi:hypothetical protein